MTVNEYKSLVGEGFVLPFRGELKRGHTFESQEKLGSILNKVKPIMMKQLTDDFDINNCIIILPINTGYGSNFLWNNRQIVDSHCTHSVNLRYKLHEMGMKEFDGKSLLDNVQKSTAMFVIDNGIVYCSAGDYPTANPLTKIFITSNKTIDQKILKDKPIFFSGFLLERLKNKNYNFINRYL